MISASFEQVKDSIQLQSSSSVVADVLKRVRSVCMCIPQPHIVLAACYPLFVFAHISYCLATVISGNKPDEKREGHGAGNWGSQQDEVAEGVAEATNADTHVCSNAPCGGFFFLFHVTIGIQCVRLEY